MTSTLEAVEERRNSCRLRGGEPAHRVAVDLADARVPALATEPGPAGMDDPTDRADARLLVTAAAAGQ